MSEQILPDAEVEARAEMRGRIVYSTLLPAVRLSRRFRIASKDLGEWLELAYLKELLDSGLKLKQAAGVLGVSVRKISMLSSRLRANFFSPEREYELPVRIEFMLWAEPLSERRIKQYLAPLDEELIDQAIGRLVEQERIVLEPGRTPVYKITRSAQRLVRDDMMSRIGGLNAMLGTVTDAIYGRFFGGDPRSFARSLHFRVRPEDHARLQQLYEEHIWPTLSELDADAASDPNALPMGIALAWAPLDLALENLNEDDEH